MREERARTHHVHPNDERGAAMVVLIGHAGVYMILALVILVIIGGGVVLAYRMSNRKIE